ncbi:hypothetical protein V511_11950 [Mesotoga sp. Brook.08.YT.4.2.5.1]|jgi:predicted nucleotidyltransferase|uniref:nucleotidyltransferase family protein n=1 Tax=unclassified Mesotoga TaxID=1184398 RepID=UPI000C18E734|nr:MULTISPECIES: nucleotidyltransferase family protein [unclassified Mesotoga]PNQ05804.1 hypothetical protein RM69_02900 [Mesotoga sp. SC_NapDC3]PXF33411.1 hypothetical protein EU77_13850 [Mesotoga sp. SC_NapDC]RAM58100.1 hypothetical protein DS65_00030 [Mesotoga sp. SC_4PWL113PWK15]RAM60484.1 hypothetical protein DS67_06145 [Mesotoga sp. SC_4PWA21]RIZ61253.1 hypothetical protein KU43_03770 [Mesotoga sp. SC_NapDC2]
MNTLEDILSKLSGKLSELKLEYKVKTIGVFGSYARNLQTESSDVDILVDFEQTPDLFEFIRLKNDLASLLEKRVDLVTRKALRKDYEDRVLCEVKYIS